MCIFSVWGLPQNYVNQTQGIFVFTNLMIRPELTGFKVMAEL
jgi:hypothetical protein